MGSRATSLQLGPSAIVTLWPTLVLPIVPKLIAVVKGPPNEGKPDWNVEAAMLALGMHGAKAKDAVPELKKCLDDKNARVAAAATKALAQIEGE